MMMQRGSLLHFLFGISLASQLLPLQAQAQVSPPPPLPKPSYCADLKWPGSGPTLPTLPPPEKKANLCPGQLFLSENGIYTALLKDNGEFIVARGDPNKPANVVWRTGVTGNGDDYWVKLDKAGFVAVVQFTVGMPLVTLWTSPYRFANPGDYFLHLSDAGTLTLTHGTPDNPGPLQWTNGVNDPIDVNNGGVDIESIAYDFEHLRSEPPTNTTGKAQLCVNDTPNPKQCALNLTLDYTKTNNFTFTSDPSIAVGYNSKTEIDAPGLVEGSDNWSITGAVEFSGGFSDGDSGSETFEIPISITVPAHTTYKAQLAGLLIKATIPFTYSGVATFKSGKKASLVNVSGVYEGADIGQFSAEISCVKAPGGCKAGVMQSLPVVKTSKGFGVMPSAGTM